MRVKHWPDGGQALANFKLALNLTHWQLLVICIGYTYCSQIMRTAGLLSTTASSK
ncbi:hypothetical protein PAXRUDRAFT_827933 [Paxillus rubicundulus Ve08.2h10]|uniref:Uncharacterized protein n=1 Tax=Paxillus rubicundulus Ve08.2h10 TaxID=930991 RepID=A0A0D0DWZ7_9AGAM|nr:hypothetical protein PAXRUDRAFT_827933 [Paxillus rubicundulus Ve08.2h10]